MTSVWLCYTYDENHNPTIVKVLDNFNEARAWRHNRSDLARKLEILYARYLLAKTKKARETIFAKYYKFRTTHGLFRAETPSSPYFHAWEVMEKGVE